MAEKLRDKIVGMIPTRRQGHMAWHERVDAKTLAELEDLRASWRAGEIESPKLTLAKAISTVVRELGVDVGPQGVVAWLDKK